MVRLRLVENKIFVTECPDKSILSMTPKYPKGTFAWPIPHSIPPRWWERHDWGLGATGEIEYENFIKALKEEVRTRELVNQVTQYPLMVRRDD